MNVLRTEAPEGDAETWATHGALPGGVVASLVGGGEATASLGGGASRVATVEVSGVTPDDGWWKQGGHGGR